MPALLLVLLFSVPDPAGWLRNGAGAEDAGRYADAISWYARVVSEASQSYQAKRAGNRLRELRPHAVDGFEAYGDFQRMLKTYPNLGSDGALAEARRIVSAHPHAAVVPEVLFWIGNEYREGRKDPEAAIAAYRELINRYPEEPRAPVALERIGRMYEQLKKYEEAAQTYAELQRRYPDAITPQAYESRRAGATRQLVRLWAYRGAWGILGVGILVFFAVGGAKVRRAVFLKSARRKAGFALLLGIAPAAFLWVYDDQWSPSLTAAGIAFAIYGTMLAALAARMSAPGGRGLAIAERILFNALLPLAIWVVIMHRFQLWEAFGL